MSWNTKFKLLLFYPDVVLLLNSSVILITCVLCSLTSLYLPLFPHQLCIFTPDVKVVYSLMLFYRLCTAVTSLSSQVEVGDIIRVNGSDFVPADAAILSSRYQSPPCCQTVETSSSFFFLLPLSSSWEVMVWLYIKETVSGWKSFEQI